MRLCLAALLIGLLASICLASPPSYTLEVKSAYYGGDSGSEFYPHPVCQGSATWSDKAGYWGVWGSLPLKGQINENGGTELDLYAGRNIKFGKVAGDVGLITYHLSPLQTIQNDYWAPYLNLCYPHGKNTVGFHCEFDGTFDPGVATGTVLHLSFGRKVSDQDLISLNLLGHPRAFGVDEEWPSAAYLRFDHKDGKVTYWARVQQAFRKDGLAADNVVVMGAKADF